MWTSADAGGQPILPGLARYNEVTAGVIRHALRFKVARTRRGFIHPASRRNDTDLDQLQTVPGSAFEAVQTGPVLHP